MRTVSFSKKKIKVITLVSIATVICSSISVHDVADAYVLISNPRTPWLSSTVSKTKKCRRFVLCMTAGEGFGTSPSAPVEIPVKELKDLSSSELKDRLVSLLSRSTGKQEENDEISEIVNALESAYSPVQTVDFFNMAMAGDWQLLFSTNRLGVPDAKLRLRELIQRIQPTDIKAKHGNLTNIASWALANNGMHFDMYGTLSVKNEYELNSQGAARMEVSLRNHLIELGKGSKAHKSVLNDIPDLLLTIRMAMPFELFDPNDMSMDTTYLDSDFRIVRFTAMGEDLMMDTNSDIHVDDDGTAQTENHEQSNHIKSSIDEEKKQKLLMLDGVRNIFIRKGSRTINPVME